MTVATKVQQAVVSAQAVIASLNGFALDTDDQQAKEMFNQLSQQQQQILDSLNARLQYIQQQEPQYNQS